MAFMKPQLSAIMSRSARWSPFKPIPILAIMLQIGDGTIVSPFVYIGDDTKIGNETLIYPNVTIREDVEIGDRVILHCGVVIGSDGFGFASVSDRHHKYHKSAQ